MSGVVLLKELIEYLIMRKYQTNLYFAEVILQNNWLELFENVNYMKHKNLGASPENRSLKYENLMQCTIFSIKDFRMRQRTKPQYSPQLGNSIVSMLFSNFDQCTVVV